MIEHKNCGTKTLLFKLEHELRQTLHSMMGMLELAAEETSSAAQAGYLSDCRTGADHLLQMANDVSELASPARAGSPCAAFCLNEMVEEVAEVMQALAVRKGLEFHLSVDPSAPKHVFAERDTIQDMLRRILDNSIKFTPRGRIFLSVTSIPADEPGATLVAFEVRDTGPGIGKEILDQLQAPVETFRAGLGFSIVQKRLAGMNGKLTVPSSGPDGAAVRISLPVKLAPSWPPASKRGAGESEVQPHGAPPMKLLVAEDSDDSYKLFQAYVKGAGHTVSRAFNGAEAVEMLKSNEYDLVVMDINMPVMDGYAATRAIREWETQRGRTRIPIVLLSAESASRQRKDGASAGCSGYLTKPVPKNEVLKVLNYFAAQSV